MTGNEFLALGQANGYLNPRAAVIVLLEQSHNGITMDLTLNQFLQKGLDAHQAGLTQEAYNLFSAILETQPNHPEANHRLGLLMVESGDAEGSLVFFKTALDANPSSGQFWLSLIDTLIQLGQTVQAQVALYQAKFKGANGEEFDLREQQLNAHELNTASQTTLAESNAHNSKPNILDEVKLEKALSLAKQKSKSGQLEAASSIYSDVLQVFPKNKQALVAILAVATDYNTRANKLVGKGNVDDAMDYYKQAIKFNPNYADSYNNMGNLFADMGNLEAASDCYKQAIKINPNFAAAYNNLGLSLMEQGATELAVNSYKQAIKIKPNHADAYNNMGNALNNKGDKDAALDSYKQAIKIKPNHADAYNNIGNVLRSQGDAKSALASYKEVLKINPAHAGAHNNIGLAHVDGEDAVAAINSYKEAINIDPTYAEAHSNMGMALQIEGELEAAIISYKQAIHLNPDHTGAYNNMGNAQRDKGDLDAALDSYKQVIKINPDSAGTHNNMGNIFRDKGELELAMNSYKQAIKIRPDFVEARMILAATAAIAVPQWHISMMNDAPRNEAYLKALNLAIGEDDVVLEIGTGSGLLSMMAADAGAKNVITCEASSTIAKAATRIIEKNGYSEKITVIDKISTELIVGKDLPRQADVVISEVLSAEFVGEGVRSTILDANQRLLSDGGRMVPESGAIKVALLGSNTEICNKISVNTIEGYDLSNFNSIMSQKISLNLNDRPTLLSNSEDAFNLNLYDSQPISKSEKVLSLKVTKSGLCLGVIQWLRVQLFDHIEYENTPGDTASHWPTPVYLFDQPLEVTAGQILEVKAVLLEDSIWFYHLV